MPNSTPVLNVNWLHLGFFLALEDDNRSMMTKKHSSPSSSGIPSRVRSLDDGEGTFPAIDAATFLEVWMPVFGDEAIALVKGPEVGDDTTSCTVRFSINVVTSEGHVDGARGAAILCIELSTMPSVFGGHFVGMVEAKSPCCGKVTLSGRTLALDGMLFVLHMSHGARNDDMGEAVTSEPDT